MEGGDLSALHQRVRRYPLSLLGVVAVTASLLVAAPLPGGAATGHAPVHMPRVVGMARARVYAIMRADGLFFQTRGPGSANATWSTVVAQSPSPGVLVAWHSQVVLTTSVSTSGELRTVPHLVGLSRSRVFALMRRQDLFFNTSGPGSTSGTWVMVVRQSPAPGARVRWHSQVQLTVSTHRAVVKRLASVSKKRTTTAVEETTATVKRPPATTTTTVRRPPATTTTSTTSTPSTTTVPGSTTTVLGGVTTTTTPAPSTTTTVKRTPTTTTTQKKIVPPRVSHYRVGFATWYAYFPGRCATWYLPMGTRVKVLNLDTGKSVTCVVTDREVARGNRVVDLSETDFAQIQPLWRGVVRVKVTW